MKPMNKTQVKRKLKKAGELVVTDSDLARFLGTSRQVVYAFKDRPLPHHWMRYLAAVRPDVFLDIRL